MARTPELTGHGNLEPTTSERLWVREQDERWSFWWRGATPLLSLCAVLAYGITAFAHKTETQIQLSVADQLSQHGLGWAHAEVRGQTVVLTGTPPSAEARSQAVALATRAECQSWLGRLPCATEVTTRFDGAAGETSSKPPTANKATTGRELDSTMNAAVPPPQPGSANAASPATPAAVAPAAAPAGSASEPRWFDLNLVRTGTTLKLEGDVASEAAQTALTEAARTHFPAGTVDNQLRAIGGDVSPEWELAAKHAIEVAARCEQGVITLANSALSVDCETQTSSARDAIIGLLAQKLTGLGSGNVSVLALDEVKACEEGLFKLVNRSQIRFTTNSAKLLPSSRPLLREISHQLEHCPGVIVVEGHTDAQGVREENVQLSLNRARAVVSGLVGLGVPAARVRAEGFGPDHPLATNETATGRAQNRRIEFRVARTGIRGE